MEAIWPGDRCIICLEKKKLTEEHIIPKALGGCLTLRFLCQKCNSTLGRKIENAARFDPSIRIAADYLKKEIPHIAKKIENKQQYIVESKGGKAKGRIINGDFRINSEKLSDGSLIQPNDIAKNTIRRKLSKRGYKDEEIEEALKKHELAQDNEIIEIAPGLEIAKWTIEKMQPDYSQNNLLSDLLPLKIAYEFLAIHLGMRIYDNAPQLDAIRATLKSLDYNITSYSNDFKVERLTSRDFKPFNGICCEKNYPYTSFQIRLFGWLVFRVTFYKIGFSGPCAVYTHLLESDDEDIRPIDDKNEN